MAHQELGEGRACTKQECCGESWRGGADGHGTNFNTGARFVSSLTEPSEGARATGTSKKTRRADRQGGFPDGKPYYCLTASIWITRRTFFGKPQSTP